MLKFAKIKKVMELYGQKNKSIPQKIVIHLIEILLLRVQY
jgi:hypothetical protein